MYSSQSVPHCIGGEFESKRVKVARWRAFLDCVIRRAFVNMSPTVNHGTEEPQNPISLVQNFESLHTATLLHGTSIKDSQSNSQSRQELESFRSKEALLATTPRHYRNHNNNFQAFSTTRPETRTHHGTFSRYCTRPIRSHASQPEHAVLKIIHTHQSAREHRRSLSSGPSIFGQFHSDSEPNLHNY